MPVRRNLIRLWAPCDAPEEKMEHDDRTETVVEKQLLTTKVAYLETQLEQAQAQIRHLAKVDDQLRCQVPSIDAILESALLRETACSEAVQKQLRDSLKRETDKVERLDETLERMTAENTRLKAEIRAQGDKLVDLMSSNDALRKTADNTHDEIKGKERDAMNHRRELQTEVKSLEEHLQDARRENENLRTKYKGKFEQWNTQHQKQLQETTKMEKLLRSRDESLLRLQQSKHDEQEKAESLSAQVACLEAQNAELLEQKEKNSSFQEKLKQVQRESDGDVSRIYTLEIQLAECQTALERNSQPQATQVVELRKALAQKTAQLEGSEKQVCELAGRLQALESLHQSATETYMQESERFSSASRKSNRQTQEQTRHIELFRKQLGALAERLTKAIYNEQRSRQELRNVKGIKEKSVEEFRKNVLELEAALEVVTGLIKDRPEKNKKTNPDVGHDVWKLIAARSHACKRLLKKKMLS